MAKNKQEIKANLEQYLTDVKYHIENFTDESKEQINKILSKVERDGNLVENKVLYLFKELKRISKNEIENAKGKGEETKAKVIELFNKRKEIKSSVEEYFAESKESVKARTSSVLEDVTTFMNSTELYKKLDLDNRLHSLGVNKNTVMTLGAVGFTANLWYNLHFHGPVEAIYKASVVGGPGALALTTAINQIWNLFSSKADRIAIPPANVVNYSSFANTTQTAQAFEVGEGPSYSSSYTPTYTASVGESSESGRSR